MSEARRLGWTSEVHYLPGNRLRCPPTGVSTRAGEAQLRRLLKKDQWPSADRSATLVHLAAHSMKDGEQELGLALITEAVSTGPPAWGDDFVEALAHLCASLAHDLASQASHRGAWVAAAEHYAVAAAQYALCMEDELSLECLHAGQDCVQRQGGLAASRAASTLIQKSTALRASISEAIGWHLYRLYQRLGYTIVGRKADVNAVIFLHQAAKGMDFALAAGDPSPLVPSASLLRRLSDPQTRISLPPDPEFPFGVETATLYYADSGEAEPENDADAQQRNLQRIVDRRISGELYTTRRRKRNHLVNAHEAQSWIPEDTVLISLFLSEMRDTTGLAKAGTQGLAVTREGFEHRTVLVEEFDGGLVQFSRPDGHTLHAHPSVGPLTMLRQAVVEDPLHRVVSRNAQRQLAEASHHCLAGLAAHLARWQSRGKRHLCIWPHGPLHYVPFHLFPGQGSLIADDWIVTQISSLAFLRPTDQLSVPKREGLVAFASADGGISFGLDSQDVLEQHARAVSEAMGGNAVLGSAATPHRFLTELENARYVHVAAHGAHNEWAPWYQCLFLSPTEVGDGRVFAHDILRRDLRGVELVTMSSCESALGRFDPNDNLRGLPAALMAAGASAVIGCLWPVHPQVATAFFASLYKHLSTDPDRRAAFRAAQIHTRGLYPAYRDWGAFCFIGDWRTSNIFEGAAR